MTNSTHHYDFFVIGGGSGGVRASRIAASHKARVGLAEAARLGGTCVNLGCVPKKLLAYAADYHQSFADARAYGWDVSAARIDWATLIAAKDKEILRLNAIYRAMIENAGVTIHDGYARFLDAHTVQINDDIVTADRFLVATGGRPRRPAIPGAEHVVTSDDAFHLETLPEEILIVGGGYIAVEFAHIFRGLGRQVTLAFRGGGILKSFDHDIAQALTVEMGKQGIRIVPHADLTGVTRDGLRLTAALSNGESLECGLVMTAIGRDLRTDDLDLEKTGVERQADGSLSVDGDYATNVPHIHAIGDIANRHNLTPVALAEGHVLADRLFGGMTERKVDYDNIATAVFSEPPIGTVGMTERQAIERGHRIEIYKSSFRPLRHTITGRDERTLMKLVVECDSGRVLGCHMMGADAPEILQGFAVAVNMGATKADFDRTIGIHPTAAEEMVTMRTPFKI